MKNTKKSSSGTKEFRLLKVPLPPSINRYYKRTRKHTKLYKSQEAKDWEAEFKQLCWTCRVKFGDQRVARFFEFHYKSRLSDISNRIKIIEDAMEGWVYDNDRQIDMGQEWRVQDEKDYVNIMVRKYDKTLDKCKLFN